MASLPPNSTILYRKCTRKSILGFGKYDDLQVGDILKIEKMYIAWIYFHKEKISFTDDILNELLIDPIKKPGTDEKGWWAWKRKWSDTFTEEEQNHGKMARARARRKYRLSKLADAEKSTRFSKGQLQAINHGHIKI